MQKLAKKLAAIVEQAAFDHLATHPATLPGQQAHCNTFHLYELAPPDQLASCHTVVLGQRPKLLTACKALKGAVAYQKKAFTTQAQAHSAQWPETKPQADIKPSLVCTHDSDLLPLTCTCRCGGAVL